MFCTYLRKDIEVLPIQHSATVFITEETSTARYELGPYIKLITLRP
jgi:hypothetical protein